MVEVLCIERHDATEFLVWIRDGASYKKVILADGEQPLVLKELPVADYKGYEHFAAVMSKFNPGYVFAADPAPIAALEFDDIEALALKFDQAQRRFARGAPAPTE